MKWRAALSTLLVLSASALCVRLGFWQLSRMHEKRVLHMAQRAALAVPPIELSGALPETPPAAGRRVRLLGRWDRTHHVLLSGRTHLGAAGVSLVTPLRLASGAAVMVERGWLAAPDARIAHPEQLADSLADVIGIAVPFAPSARPSAWVRLAADSPGVSLWSARALEADSSAVHIAGTFAKWMLRALPETAPHRGTSGEAMPIAEPVLVADEAMHLSYAIQWFGFALIIGLGSLALARRRRPGAGSA